MPGVPSSRGCDACRRQKKKCDLVKPTCGRCARLYFECTGGGQQRYKFHNKTVAQPPGRSRLPRSSPGGDTTSSSDSASESSSRTLSARDQGTILFSPPSGNAQSVIVGRLVSALEISDPRFDLSVYGTFLRDIPRRVGTSRALDAAAAALATTLPLVVGHTRYSDSDKPLLPVTRATVPMLWQYGRALHALRASLNDPATVAAPNTLCALYLVVICQGWLQNDEGHFASHGEAVAMILRSMKSHRPSWGAFEESIMYTMCFLVIMESFVNPRIQLDDDLWRRADPHGPHSALDESVRIDSLSNQALARIAKLLRAPKTRQHELAEAYNRVRIDRVKVANLLASIEVAPSIDGRTATPVSEALCHAHLRWQVAYAMLTLVAMRIGALLSAAAPFASDDDVLQALDLNGDFHTYIDDIATVAEQALQYYPLGSSFMPLSLLAAYSTLRFAGSDVGQRTRILRLFSEYQPGFDLEKKLSDISEAAQPRVSSPRRATSRANEDLGAVFSQRNMCCIL